jgi:hypothetical protein
MTQILKKIGLAGVLCGSMAFGACGSMGMGRNSQTWTMATAENASAAVGKVQVANQKDGNTKVKVEVDHLAPPAVLTDQTSAAYVVWIKPATGAAQNVGVLQVGSSRKGELETKTPFKTFTVMVTLEKSASVTVPTGETMMDTHVTMPS